MLSLVQIGVIPSVSSVYFCKSPTFGGVGIEIILHAACPGLKLDGASSYLVDPAWTDVFISKIKPCMYKYKRLDRETANGSL